MSSSMASYATIAPEGDTDFFTRMYAPAKLALQDKQLIVNISGSNDTSANTTGDFELGR